MTKRVCYYTNESFYNAEVGKYEVVKVTENEPGYSTDPAFSYLALVSAQAVADRLNERLGLTKDAVLDIVASSMRQGKVR